MSDQLSVGYSKSTQKLLTLYWDGKVCQTIDLSKLNGSIKTIHGPTHRPIFEQLARRARPNSSNCCHWSYEYHLTILTDTGKLYQLCCNCHGLREYPFIHSELGGIDQVAFSPWQMYLLDKKGTLFEVLPATS